MHTVWCVRSRYHINIWIFNMIVLILQLLSSMKISIKSAYVASIITLFRLLIDIKIKIAVCCLREQIKLYRMVYDSTQRIKWFQTKISNTNSIQIFLAIDFFPECSTRIWKIEQFSYDEIYCILSFFVRISRPKEDIRCAVLHSVSISLEWHIIQFTNVSE